MALTTLRQMDTPSLPTPLRRTPANLAANRTETVLVQWARQFRMLEPDTGLTAERIELLSLLEVGGPITAGELAEELRASRPAVTRMVDGLERAGLVQRGGNILDGRSVVVRITTSGKRRLNRARGNRVKAMASRLRGRSDRELAQLEQGLRILSEMLDS